MANPTKLMFTAPVTNTDGTPFLATDLQGFEFSFDGGAFVTGVTTSPSAGKYEAVLPQFSLGFGSHTVQVRTVGKNGLKSDPTNSVSFTLADERKPNPPTSLQVV